jgi:hypothetical protein
MAGQCPAPVATLRDWLGVHMTEPIAGFGDPFSAIHNQSTVAQHAVAAHVLPC